MAEEATQSIRIPGWGRFPLSYIRPAIIRETQELDEMEANSMCEEQFGIPPGTKVASSFGLDSSENEAMENSPKEAFVVTNNSSAIDTRDRSD